MSDIAESRLFSTLSNKKLRRARALYKYIVSPFVHNNPRLSLILCKRCVDAGLFSSSNTMNDIVFSLIRAAHKRFGNMESWHQYTDSRQITFLWFEAKLYYRKTPKGWQQKRKVRIRC